MKLRIKKRGVTVYKVVRVLANGDLVSAIDTIPQSWLVTYRPGRWTFPTKKRTALFAFRGKGRAIEWGQTGMAGKRQVWQATAFEVDGVLDHGFGRLLRCGGLGWQALVSFWKSPRKYGERVRHPSLTPHGGVWCSRVRLEKRVK